METPNDTQTNTIVEIAPDGDLILIVGPEEAKLHVDSMMLRAASKLFSAMFGPNWKEGRDLLNGDRLTEIPLPEDNAAAMKIICSVIHHQRSEVPRTLAAGDVLAVAVAADKYDCVEALELASDRWLRPSGDEAGNLMLLTAAAYLFQNAQAFKELTKALILDYKDPYLTLSCKEVESAMPWKVFCLLEEQRGSARLRVADILMAGLSKNPATLISPSTVITIRNNNRFRVLVKIAPEAREMVCEAENPPPHADGPDCSNFECPITKRAIVPLK
ncbi:BTB domain-containing protein [Trichoderma simmonsii]|uniref:BTB domain-containing protein n=1 Tax=Trichoderma simmonsii TaxID=1491479 RepID=A0A8G0LIS3_9HYPO|nr:BTB domain-containing protein [Trichoderma simmonsii]